MSNTPSHLKYTESHEWVLENADGSITVGISDHAQEVLGDLVFIELPAVGKTVAAGDNLVVVESVKAAADVYAPVAGTVTEINEAVAASPESLNEDAYAAWLFKMKPANAADIAKLLSAEAYEKTYE